MSKYQKIGSKIKKMRELRNFTQDFVAESIGISQASYSEIETDKTDVSLSRLSQIAEVLGVSTSDIISFDERLILHINENKGLASNVYKNMTDTKSVDKIEALNERRFEEMRQIYESRLQDKDKEIARLSQIVEKMLNK
jgi:transcriptional regulator with XRE-family HTH domain